MWVDAGARQRDAWIVVDLESIRHNARLLRAKLAPGVRMMACVKAYAYGHEPVETARALLAEGVEELCVATIEEGVLLRAAGIRAPILILGAFPCESAETLIANDLTVTVFAETHITALAKAGRALGLSPKVHLKVDTGMTRLGVRTEDELLDVAQLCISRGLFIAGIYTHFAFADEALDETFTDRQLAMFQNAVARLRAAGIDPGVVHAANSAGLLRSPSYHLDMVRPGIALYGYHPAPQWGQALALRPALSVYARIVRIADVPAGTSVGYGCAYTCAGASRIATLPLGYADGIPRAAGRGAQVDVGGRAAPIVGRVCMDQLMIDVTETDARVGDVVQVYGAALGCAGSLQATADVLETISYELLCRLSMRLPRVIAHSVTD